MSGVVMVGNGGHARACVDAWTTEPGLALEGCVGPDSVSVLDVPHLGADDDLAALFDRGLRKAFVAVGDGALRATLVERCRALGFELVSSVAPTAHVGESAVLGAGVIVMHGAVVGAVARIGEGSIVNTRASVDHDCEIGRYTHVAPGTSVAGSVVVGDHVLLGIGSCVIPGVHIGDRAVVGAGAVVVRDVPAGATVVSTPAKELNR